MNVRNLVLINGDMYEGGTLDISQELLERFVKITYEGGRHGYIDPDCIVSFDEAETSKPTILKFKK